MCKNFTATGKEFQRLGLKKVPENYMFWSEIVLRTKQRTPYQKFHGVPPPKPLPQFNVLNIR